jgi:hypothetical protein
MRRRGGSGEIGRMRRGGGSDDGGRGGLGLHIVHSTEYVKTPTFFLDIFISARERWLSVFYKRKELT